MRRVHASRRPRIASEHRIRTDNSVVRSFNLKKIGSPGAIVFIGRIDLGDQKLTSSMRPRSACANKKSNHALSVSAMQGWSANTTPSPRHINVRDELSSFCGEVAAVVSAREWGSATTMLGYQGRRPSLYDLTEEIKRVDVPTPQRAVTPNQSPQSIM